jgi:hypothetical protein
LGWISNFVAPAAKRFRPGPGVGIIAVFAPLAIARFARR